MNLRSLIQALLQHESHTNADIQLVEAYLQHEVFIHELKQHLELKQVSSDLEQPQPFELLSDVTSLSTQPICAYLSCLQSIPHNDLINLWAVHNLHAACILKSLTTDQNQDHHNTIVKIFDRFRIATQAYFNDKQGKKLSKIAQQYLWLWEQLPYSSISLEEFVHHLINLEKQPELTRFQYLLIVDIRRFYAYVLALKAKKNYTPSASLDNPIHYLDDAESTLLLQDSPPCSLKPSLFYEQQTDNTPDQHYQIDSLKVSPVAQQSSVLQRTISKVTGEHIQRQQHLFSCSNHYPDLDSMCLLIDYCEQTYRNNPTRNKPYLIILLSFLTGVPIEQWLHIQSKTRIALNQRQKIIDIDGYYFLRSKFTLFQDPQFEFQAALLNQITYFDLPLANHLIHGLKQTPITTQDEVSKALKQCREALYIPSLTSKKISVLLHAVIYHHTQSLQLADILTGMDANRSSSISYCSYPIYKLQICYQDVVEKLSITLAQHIHVSDDQNLYFGSLKAPNFTTIRSIFAYLNSQIIKAHQQHEFIAIFNHYNIWLWHVLLLFTAARPVADFPGFLQDIDLQQKLLWVSDKEIHGRHHEGRLLPLCDFVIIELKAFFKYLIHCRSQLINHTSHINAIFNNEIPLLSVYSGGMWQPLSPQIVSKFTNSMQLEHANWLRHASRAYLTGKFSENYILALFGHEKNQQQLGHSFSSLSLNQYKELTHALNQMKDDFQIDGVSEYDLC